MNALFCVKHTMEITKLIELLTEAKETWHKSVFRANQEREKWWDFEVEYSESEEWESGDVILTIATN